MDYNYTTESASQILYSEGLLILYIRVFFSVVISKSTAFERVRGVKVCVYMYEREKAMRENVWSNMCVCACACAQVRV